MRKSGARRREPVQLTLDQARKPTGHGGSRPGAGRPRGRKTVSHDAREAFAPRFPVHVTWRVVEGVRSLRREAVLDVVRAKLAAHASGDAFRVVEFNVLGDHLHLVVEASGKEALWHGLQGLAVRLVRAINKTFDRKGELFAERYHARVLRTSREVRNVLRYVLLNARHHAAERGQKLARDWVDPYSSGPWFDGWRAPIRSDAPWLERRRKRARPTAAARTWLLASGWRRHGLLAFDEVPGGRDSLVGPATGAVGRGSGSSSPPGPDPRGVRRRRAHRRQGDRRQAGGRPPTGSCW